MSLIESIFKMLGGRTMEGTETLPDTETTPSAPPRERPDKPGNPIVPSPNISPKPKGVSDVDLFMKNRGLTESVEDIQDLINIQTTEPSVKTDRYMAGLANGLLIAKACMTNEEAELVDCPKTEESKVTEAARSTSWCPHCNKETGDIVLKANSPEPNIICIDCTGNKVGSGGLLIRDRDEDISGVDYSKEELEMSDKDKAKERDRGNHHARFKSGKERPKIMPDSHGRGSAWRQERDEMGLSSGLTDEDVNDLQFEDLLWKYSVADLRPFINHDSYAGWRARISPRRLELLKSIYKRKQLGEARVTEADVIHPDKQAFIDTGDEKLNKILPQLSDKEKSYLQTIASEAYTELVARIENYTGITVNNRNIPKLCALMFQACHEVVEIEKTQTAYLEEWAVMLPLQLPEFKMVEDAYTAGSVKFDAKLESPDFKGTVEDQKPEEGELSPAEELNLGLVELLQDASDAEIQRRFANLLIQGGASAKLYLYNLMNEKLEAINPRLPKLYGILASLGQLGYWITPDGFEYKAAGGDEMEGGTEEVKPEGEIYTIIAKGTVFPYLVHEVVKGIYEWISITPEHEEAMKTDKLADEPKDIMVGSKVWQAINSYLSEEDQELMPMIQKEVILLKPDQIQAVLAKDVEGKKIMDDMLVRARKAWGSYQSQKADYAKESVDGLAAELYAELMLDESVASAKALYLDKGKVDQEQFDAAQEVDPSPNKKYMDWICRTIAAEEIKPEQVKDGRFDVLNRYMVMQPRATCPAEIKDITKVKTLADLVAGVEAGEAAATDKNKMRDAKAGMKAKEAPKSKYQVPRMEEGAKIVVENDQCLIALPFTEAAAIFWGNRGVRGPRGVTYGVQDARWCTARKEGCYWGSSYIKSGKTVYFLQHKGARSNDVTKNDWAVAVDSAGEHYEIQDFQNRGHSIDSPEVKGMMEQNGLIATSEAANTAATAFRQIFKPYSNAERAEMSRAEWESTLKAAKTLVASPMDPKSPAVTGKDAAASEKLLKAYKRFTETTEKAILVSAYTQEEYTAIGYSSSDFKNDWSSQKLLTVMVPLSFEDFSEHGLWYVLTSSDGSISNIISPNRGERNADHKKAFDAACKAYGVTA